MENREGYAADDKTILRKPHNAENPYVVITKNIFEDDDISWRAKGMMGYLLSRPDDWTIIIGDLVNRAPEGRTAVRSILRELEKHGYLFKQTLRDAKGHWAGTEMIVLESPLPPKQRSWNPKVAKPPADTPHVGDPSTVGPDADDSPLLSIDLVPSIDLTKEEPAAPDSPAPLGTVTAPGEEPIAIHYAPESKTPQAPFTNSSGVAVDSPVEDPDVAETEAMFNKTSAKKLSKEEFESRHNGVAAVTGQEMKVSHDIPGQPWCNQPVEAWCELAGKSYEEMTIQTRIKLGGIFYKVGTVTKGDPAQVAEAIGNFKAEHPWWKYDFDWPSEGFLNRLGMMLVPDAQPEPINLDGGGGDTRPIRL